MKKPTCMGVSPSAYDMISAFYVWLEESNKTTYRFSIEEQQQLEWMIKVIANQIDALVEYELKNK